jgi:hypothetical protein
MELVFDGDSYPAMQIGAYNHDNVAIAFDSYYTDSGGWRSSDIGSNFAINKITDRLTFKAKGGVDSGVALSFWLDALHINQSGDVYTLFDRDTAWTPTVLGFSTTPLLDCHYRRVGKRVECIVNISGLGDAVGTKLTLPQKIVSSEKVKYNITGQPILFGYFDGANWLDASQATIALGVSGEYAVVKVDHSAYTDLTTGSVYGSGCYKWLCGTFAYEVI